MNHAATDLLHASGLPVFFALDDAAARGFAPPANRYGQSVRVYARSLAGMQKEAVVVSAMNGRAWRLASDEGPYLNGFDRAPCPLSFMTTGMVCSYFEEIVQAAREFGAACNGLTLTLDNFYSMQGSALKGTMIGGALPPELSVQIDAQLAQQQAAELIERAIARSPVQGLLAGELHSRFSLNVNGDPTAVGRVQPLDSSAKHLSWPAFDMSDQAEPLIQRINAIDPNNSGPGGAGTSLAADQDRRLHVRGVCHKRADGRKEVQQFLFSPRGSVFRYLCAEANGASAQARAPDAASYMAAGVAFCFMTQLGRYAHIVKQPLDEYAVIQDIHFPRPGAGGGEFDPVETHVFLSTSAGADFARKVVDMGEQTCFLHALCRTPLQTSVRIVRG